ncbi:sulfotransferase family protein [Halomonas ventosae]|uniref:Sulfotransferase family protein n=1 Tax=Halomonas ventosae TaxID=229007 RepID=A0A2T0VB13_9GAMM|nr:sulfotransferase [Halomonas ventosae]PRY67390.1 sulfotransferase family protein [Halomonas ventosae]
MHQSKSDPIIFVGMHRSGTSLLGRLLEQLGLFVGSRKDENNEALLFLKLNTWLLSQCGARWDHPEVIADLWSEEAAPVISASTDYVKDLMSSPRAIEYLGIKKYIQFRSIDNIQCPWGWKDPRNTFTLPFWLNIFPEARVVFIERHGVDVAESLRVRAERSVRITMKRYEHFKPVAWVRPKRGGFSESPRCLSLEGGLSLWESYQERAHARLNGLEVDRVFRVRYEELLYEPFKILKGLTGFCGLSVADERVARVTSSVNADRAYSYRHNPELIEFSNARKDRLQSWGYTS